MRYTKPSWNSFDKLLCMASPLSISLKELDSATSLRMKTLVSHQIAYANSSSSFSKVMLTISSHNYQAIEISNTLESGCEIPGISASTPRPIPCLRIPQLPKALSKYGSRYQ